MRIVQSACATEMVFKYASIPLYISQIFFLRDQLRDMRDRFQNQDAEYFCDQRNRATLTGLKTFNLQPQLMYLRRQVIK